MVFKIAKYIQTIYILVTQRLTRALDLMQTKDSMYANDMKISTCINLCKVKQYIYGEKA